MRYELGRFHRPMRRSTESQLVGLVSLGDGSTLTLDFTTGVLDPRLTFTRASTGTFINSSGLVQWANANIVRHSENCTNWGGAQNITPTADAAVAPNGTQTADQLNLLASSYRYNITATSPQRVINGMQYTGSIWIRAVSGTASVTLRINNNITGTNQGVKTVTVTETWTREFVSFTLSSSTGTAVEFGLDQRSIIGGANVAANVYVWGMQIQPGNVVGEYLPTTTTENYNTPRFDHDPTTLAPRGLLIEGTATNLTSYSEDFSNAAWTKSGTNGTMPLTGTAPDNNAASRLLEENTTTYAKHSLERSISISAGIYTFSVWLKEPSTNSRRYAHIQLADGQATAARYTIVADLQTGTITASGANNGTAGAPTGTGHSITAYPNGWYRVTISMNHVASPSYPTILLGDSASLFGGNNQPFYSATTPYKGLLFWGAQLEAGSGASSYIPTGASTVQRLADNCYIYDSTTTGGLSWFKTATQGTFYVEMFKRTAGTAFAAAGFGTRATSSQDFMLYQAVGNNWLSFNWGASESITNYSALSSPFLLKAAVALSPSTPATEADSTMSINGSNSALNTGPNIALPFTSDLFCIGSRGPAGGTASSQNYAETAIRRIKFFPFAMTAAQMNAMTTL